MKALRENDFAYQAVYRYLMLLINESGSGCAVRLPSLRQLSERLNVSISTIQYAYALLEREGRVYSVAKSGYYAQASTPLATHGGADLLETVYFNARRPGMCVLSSDDPASLQPLDSPLLMLERELLRQYPRQPQLLAQPCGELELRTVLAARYTTSAVNYWHADDVYIGADLRGVLEILIAVLQLRGTTVVVESPCDWMILRLFESAEVGVIELPVHVDGSLDPQQLMSLLNSQRRVGLILLSSVFSAPHGSLGPATNRRAIARLLAEHGTWVLENDCSSELVDESGRQPLRDWLDPDRLLVFSAFDKFIGAEAPYGFVLSRQWRSELQRHFLLRSFRLSSTRQKAIARLYASGRIDQHLQILRRRLQESRTGLLQLLQERLGDALQIIEPQGGATIWLQSLRAVDMSAVFSHLLSQQILIAPGELFSLQGRYKHHLRLSAISHSHHDLPGVVGLLGDALRLASDD